MRTAIFWLIDAETLKGLAPLMSHDFIPPPLMEHPPRIVYEDEPPKEVVKEMTRIPCYVVEATK